MKRTAAKKKDNQADKKAKTEPVAADVDPALLAGPPELEGALRVCVAGETGAGKSYFLNRLVLSDPERAEAELARRVEYGARTHPLPSAGACDQSQTLFLVRVRARADDDAWCVTAAMRTREQLDDHFPAVASPLAGRRLPLYARRLADRPRAREEAGELLADPARLAALCGLEVDAAAAPDALSLAVDHVLLEVPRGALPAGLELDDTPGFGSLSDPSTLCLRPCLERADALLVRCARRPSHCHVGELISHGLLAARRLRILAYVGARPGAGRFATDPSDEDVRAWADTLREAAEAACLERGGFPDRAAAAPLLDRLEAPRVLLGVFQMGGEPFCAPADRDRLFAAAASTPPPPLLLLPAPSATKLSELPFLARSADLFAGSALCTEGGVNFMARLALAQVEVAPLSRSLAQLEQGVLGSRALRPVAHQIVASLWNYALPHLAAVRGWSDAEWLARCPAEPRFRRACRDAFETLLRHWEAIRAAVAASRCHRALALAPGLSPAIALRLADVSDEGRDARELQDRETYRREILDRLVLPLCQRVESVWTR